MFVLNGKLKSNDNEGQHRFGKSSKSAKLNIGVSAKVTDYRKVN